MKIKLLLFASLRDHFGAGQLLLEAPPGITAKEFLSQALQKAPLAEERVHVLRLAVNGEFCEADQALQDGDELALIPPVSGGRS